MLDDRQLKCIEMKAVGIEVTKIALDIGISRTTYYEWAKLEEFKAEAYRREQEFIFSTKQAVVSYAPRAMAIIKDLAENAISEKIRLEAAKILLDKVISNAIKVELNNGNEEQDSISLDMLDEELKEFDMLDNE